MSALPDGDAAPRRTIWFDLTTSIKLAGIPPVGITRVERHYAAALRSLMPGRVRFCRFDPVLGRFRVVEDRAVQRLLEAGGTAGGAARCDRKNGVVRRTGRTLERRLRRGLRSASAWLAGHAPGLPVAGAAPFAPGDVLVLAGETWEHHDPARIAAARRFGIVLVVLLYDLIPVRLPQFYEAHAVARFAAFLETVAREAALVLCISRATRLDFEGYAGGRGLPVPPAAVVPLGHDLPTPSPEPPAGLPSAVGSGRYVLYVSTIQVRKNHQLLYQIWRRLAEMRGENLPYLVFAGSPGYLVDDLLRLVRTDPLTAGRIVILSGASDAELSWLYRNCLFTVYPSLYEGWGLPISESLAHGKVCIASTTTAMPEAGQALAIHIDPLDGAAWRREIESLIDDAARRAVLEAAIRARYRPLGWTAAGEAFAASLGALPKGG